MSSNNWIDYEIVQNRRLTDYFQEIERKRRRRRKKIIKNIQNKDLNMLKCALLWVIVDAFN